jgi:hypothetical protein
VTEKPVAAVPLVLIVRVCADAAAVASAKHSVGTSRCTGRMEEVAKKGGGFAPS